MATFFNRFLSLSVCGFYVYLIHSDTGSPERTFKTSIGLFFPLVCIWFGDYLGQYTGFMRGHYVSQQTPGWLVAAGGWFILIGAPLVAYLLSKGI